MSGFGAFEHKDPFSRADKSFWGGEKVGQLLALLPQPLSDGEAPVAHGKCRRGRGELQYYIFPEWDSFGPQAAQCLNGEDETTAAISCCLSGFSLLFLSFSLHDVA